jgi:hypothetical protein
MRRYLHLLLFDFFVLIGLILLLNNKSFSQFDSSQNIFFLKNLTDEGVLLDKGWKFHAGDDLKWAKPNIEDNEWENLNPTTDIHYLPQVRNAKVCWFWLQLQLDSYLIGKPLALVLVRLALLRLPEWKIS